MNHFFMHEMFESNRVSAVIVMLLSGLMIQPTPLNASSSALVFVQAENESSASVTDKSSETDENITLLERTEAAHLLFSNSLERTARKLDGFFAEDKSFDEATETYARVRIDMTLDEQAQAGFDGDIKIKIDLPRTERELKLLIETDTKNGAPVRPDDTPVDAVQRQDYLLSVERIGQLDTWDIRPAVGIKLRWPPDPFLRLRAIRYRELGKWLERASGSVFWFASDGFGVNSALQFDRSLGENLLFRSISTLQWKADDQFLRADQLFSLYHQLDQRQYLVYQIGGQASQDPDWALDQYTAAVHYRKNIYKKWLFFELIPQLDYRKTNDYDVEPSITFRLEGVFGREYL